MLKLKEKLMPTLSTTDHTIGFNMGGTWVELATFADEFGVLSQRVLRVERSCKGQCGHNQGSEVSFVVHVK